MWQSQLDYMVLDANKFQGALEATGAEKQRKKMATFPFSIWKPALVLFKIHRPNVRYTSLY